MALFLLTTVACHAKIRYPSAASGYSITIEDEHGRTLTAYQKDGRSYVPGQYNQRYRIRIHNHTRGRIEAVITVDGRNVISGQVGDYSEQRGYIVDGHDSVLISGFRQSQSHVASFRFTTPSDSYSARMGTPQHVGVIGVAVFPEKQRRHAAIPPFSRGPSSMDGHYAEGRSAFNDMTIDSPSSGMGGASTGLRKSSRVPRTSQNLGTRYGESRRSPVHYVSFVRAHETRPTSILAIYYDDVSGLTARGIQIHPSPISRPVPFPRHVHYAPPPP